MLLRTLAERATRGIVLKRRLPPEFGGSVLHVAPEIGGLRYWRRNLFKVDSTLLATGANVGLFSFSAAALAGADGYVLAVEADIEAAALLLRTNRGVDTRTNARVEVFCAAIHGDVGRRTETFDIAARARAANAIHGFGSSQSGGFSGSRTVPAFTLDELLEFFPPPKIVKIDVEGAEVVVLSGATRLLRDVRPTLAIEVDSENQREAGNILTAAGYDLFDGEKANWPEVSLPTWACIAIPGEQRKNL
jgi:FkbM family methyltransferase